MRHAFVGRALVVHLDEVGRRDPATARASSTIGTARACERALQLGRHPARRLGQDHAVDALGEEQAQVERFLLRVVVAAGDEQRVAGGMGRVLGAADDLGKERVGDIGHDHAERLRLLLRQAAREQVGLVAERA